MPKKVTMMAKLKNLPVVEVDPNLVYDSNQIIKILRTSKSNFNKRVNDKKFPAAYGNVKTTTAANASRVGRYEQPVTKTVWLKSDVQSFIDKILDLEGRGYNVKAIQSIMNTSRYIVLKVISYQGAVITDDMRAFNLVLAVSSKLGAVKWQQ